MIWNIDPTISICNFTIRLYGLMFAIGITLAAFYLIDKAKKLNYTEKQISVLIIISFCMIFLGARLAHCLFYEFAYYKHHIVEMLLPITQQPDGSWSISGYHGLASHGGAAGVLLAILAFYFYTKRSLLSLMDVMAIATCVLAGFIRIGNLFNSEIVGAPTDVPWAFTFPAYDDIPRHPAQLYESIFYFSLFAICAFFYKKQIYKDGLFLGIIFLAISLFRFLIEFVKEVQENFESTMTLNVGQYLSIPFILAGAFIIYRTHKER